MEVYAAVRQFVFVEGLSRRGAARGFGLSRETVAKIYRISVPPGYRRERPAARPKLGPLVGVIDAILEADRDAVIRCPRGLAHHEDRLARLRACQETIDARAAEERASGKRRRGRKPKAAEPDVDAERVVNPTDPESGIMKTRRGWVQGYNAQAVVTWINPSPITAHPPPSAWLPSTASPARP